MLLPLIAGLATALMPASGEGLPKELEVSRADVFAALDLTTSGLEAVKQAVEAGDLDRAAQEWSEYMRTRERPTLYFDREVWPEFIREHMAQMAAPLIEAADAVGGDEIGHGPYRMPIIDGVLQWEHNPTKDTNYVSVVGSQWLLTPLGRAYLLTGDDKYAKAFAWFFDSWFEHRGSIEQHQGGLGFAPIYHAYYPGVRLRVLADNYYCFAPSGLLTPDLQMRLMRELLGAARWLHARNRSFQVGNQQVAAVHGEAIVGLLLPELKESGAWVEQASQRMLEHLRRDFFADGGHKELCTQYHKTVLRDVGFVGLTQSKNGLPSLLQGESGKLLQRAYDWLAALVMPTGHTPPLHSAVFANDWVIHLTIGSLFMDRPDFWWLAKREWGKGIVPSQKGPVSQAASLIGDEFGPVDASAVAPSAPDYHSIHLNSSGFAVMRTGWQPEARYLVLQYGWANTGHAYPGALSYILGMNDEIVATHPGSPRSYRHAAYGYCHSTRSHNVVTIDNASYTPKGKHAPGGELEHLADVEGAWYARGLHKGYEPLFGAVHGREVLLIKDGPVIWYDQVKGGTGRTARWHFHTPLEAYVGGRKRAHLSGRGRYCLLPADPEAITQVEEENRWEAVLPRDCQPEDCGKVVPALAWVKPIGEEGASFGMALVESDDATFEQMGDGAFELTVGEDRYLIGFDAQRVGAIATDARCACVRFRANKAVAAWVFEGTRLKVDGTVWLATDQSTDAGQLRP